MQPDITIIKTTSYERTYKHLYKKHKIYTQIIAKTLYAFRDNPKDPRLHYKKIICKQDKNRYSIRLLNNSGYRIIMSIIDNIAYLICICDHDDYDRRNRNC